MQGRCEKHLFEEAEDRCGTCGAEFCGECLVYSFGPKRPPYCIPCAVAAAGIRRTAGSGALGRREAKRLERERRSAFKAARKAAAMAPPPVEDIPAPEPITVTDGVLPVPQGLSVPQGLPAQ